MFDRIISYVMHVCRTEKQFSFNDFDIIVMDKTVVWNDIVSNNTVEVTGSMEVPVKLTGHGNVRVAVCLTGKLDGSNCKSSIVFKGAKRQSKFLHKKFKRKGSVATSTNGLINKGLTLRWCSNVLRKFSFRKQLLAWDSCEAHLTDNV